MSVRAWDRAGAACGVAWPILVTGAFGLVAGAHAVPQSRRPSTAELQALAPPGAQAWLGQALFFLGALAYLAFSARLWGPLRRAEGEPGWRAALVLAASVVYVAAKFPQHGAVQAMWAGADPATAWALSDQLLFLSLCPLTLALAVTVSVTLSDGGLPRWLGWTGIPVAIAMGAAVVSGAFVLAMPYVVWVAAAGVALLRERPPTLVPSGMGAASAAT